MVAFSIARDSVAVSSLPPHWYPSSMAHGFLGIDSSHHIIIFEAVSLLHIPGAEPPGAKPSHFISPMNNLKKRKRKRKKAIHASSIIYL